MSWGEPFRRVWPAGYRQYARWWRSRQRRRIAKVLELGRPHDFTEDEELFQKLQKRTFPPRGEQDFDELSCWTRAAERFAVMRQRGLISSTGLRVFEGSCGDGLTGYLLKEVGCEVVLNDMDDWRHPNARGLPFLCKDLCQTQPLEPASFDLLFAFNSFEHIPDPALALHELLRLCKPGGHIYLDFGPLYYSPWGLHAWCFNFPYAQFLFSPKFIAKKVAELGVMDLGRARPALQPTNAWRLGAFRKLWRDAGCEVVHLFEDVDYRYLGFIEEFGHAFSGRGLSFEDVTVNSIEVVLRKPAASPAVQPCRMNNKAVAYSDA